MVKPATKSNGKDMPTKKRGSPAKKKMDSPPGKKKNGLTIRAYVFASPISIEAYVFERNSMKDGYTHGARKYLRGDFGLEKHEGLESLGWIRLFTRREPFSANEPLKDVDGYNRCIFARYPPDQESTQETRQAACNALRDFFMDDRFSDYPAPDVTIENNCKEDEPEPLDKFFKDEQIKEFLIHEVPDDDLNNTFVTQYPDFAVKCWAGPHKSEWARASLGYTD